MTKQDAGSNPLKVASDSSTLVARVVKGQTLGLGPSIWFGKDAAPNDDDEPSTDEPMKTETPIQLVKRHCVTVVFLAQ